VLDVHAEATSEKLAIANWFDGRINVIYGTHTHVQTSDKRIFRHGTGYLTDLGMCGPIDSILGVSCDRVIAKFRTKLPVRFETPSGECELNGAVFTVSLPDGRVTDIELIRQSIG
jgi:calcineurin-like phosphoesterase